MVAVTQIGTELGVAATCKALGVAKATYYRNRQPKPAPQRRTPPRRALSPFERQSVLQTLHEPRFVDLTPAEVYAQLLEEGRYLCSVRTMYRILESNQEVKERRNQRRHAHYSAPELLATQPNQLWSWDITKLLGPQKWTYFYLYVIMDVFSRFIVGWMVAHRESAALAEKLLEETCHRQGIQPGQLTIHADRGTSMKSKTVALLLSDLGVTKTHSRPHVSNDNPYSEAGFKTLKYRPDFPQRFGSIQDARNFCNDFVNWYNQEHYHSGISLLRPIDLHTGQAHSKIEQRNQVLNDAWALHPERFVNGKPHGGMDQQTQNHRHPYQFTH